MKCYEKVTCRYKIISNDKPLMDFEKHGAAAPFVGFWNAMRLKRRFCWDATKLVGSVVTDEESIGSVNLFSSVNKDGVLEMKCDIDIIALRVKQDSVIHVMKQSRNCVYKLAQDIGAFLIDEEFSDVVIVVQQQEIKVHKLILAARSPVFRAMFTVDMKENRECRINIPDVSYDAAKEFLDFVYCAKISALNHPKDLIILADLYQIEELKDACENKLLMNLCKENALDNLYIANLYSCKSKLKNRAFEMIAK